jgi:hypothetical protein
LLNFQWHARQLDCSWLIFQWHVRQHDCWASSGM